MSTRKNINRGYMKLIVWQDARELYKITWEIFKEFPYELKKVASNQISSVDSIHRNISEGYCRKSISEYLHFLNIAQSSMEESVSGCNTYHYSGHINSGDFEKWDILAYKIENGLKKLIESLETKKYEGTWNDSLLVKESNALLLPIIKNSSFPVFHYSSIPSFQIFHYKSLP